MGDRLAKKVLLIGWDAADWKVAAPLMDAGKMPHLEKLVSEGVMGNITTLYPVLSPMLWTSIGTGKRAHKHGILGFAEPDFRSGKIRAITNLNRKCKAVWNILNQNGLVSNVVGWWPSFPAEPINGVMVSNHFQDAGAEFGKEWPMRPGTVFPAELQPQLAKFRVHPGELSLQHVLPFVPKAAEMEQQTKHTLTSLIKTIADASSTHAVATALMEHEPWDFMAVYYDAIDHFCHAYMKFHPPRLDWIDEQEYELFQGVINGAYQFHDMMLGTLLSLAGEDTTVILLSDHGFHSDHLRPRDLPNEPAGPADEHRRFGMFVMRGPGIKRDELIHGVSLLDVTPTILTLFGLPVAKDMDGSPIRQAFDKPEEIDTIESWENVAGDSGQHPKGASIELEDTYESLKNLVALGYIQKPDDDQDKAVADTLRELDHNLARSYLGANMIPEAIEVFQRLWDQFPDEGRFGVKLFECQLILRQTSDAEATLKRLVAEKTRYSQAALAELKTLEAEWKDRKPSDFTTDEKLRLRNLKSKATVNPDTMSYLNGALRHVQKRYTEAIKFFSDASGVEVHLRPSLYKRRGDCLIALRRWNEAATEFHNILGIDPADVDARIGLARAFLGMRRAAKALREATAAVGMVYFLPTGHYLCGRALRRMRRYPEAANAFKIAVSQNPVFPKAHVHLAYTYQLMGELELADYHLKLARATQQQADAFRSGAVAAGEPDTRSAVVTDEAARVRERKSIHTGQKIGANTVVVVSGLPRSGTSMMMQMLAVGGVPVLVDEKRPADSDNPRGYFEYEPSKVASGAKSWLDEARGKAVKLVAQLVPGLPPGPDYRVIFMERSLADVVASQRAMLQRLDREGARISDSRLAQTYLQQIANIDRHIQQRGDQFSVLGISYQSTMDDPRSIANTINEFLGGDLDLEAMIAAVDPSLQRQSKTNRKS